MTTKAQASTISLRTLGGLFEQPKMNHRRDFLRENKLSIRELQKNNNQKLAQQKEEHESRQYKHLQKFHKTQMQALARRSASQCRTREQNCKSKCRVTGRSVEGNGVVDSGDGDGAVEVIRGKPNYLASRRAYSQQRQKCKNPQTTMCCCIHEQQKLRANETQHRERMPRSASSVSIVSKTESCDKEIQTEDINDENFLYEALKKCSSSEVRQSYKQKSTTQLNTKASNTENAHLNNNSQEFEPELHSTHSREGTTHVSQLRYEDNKSEHEQKSRHTSRSEEGEMGNIINEDLDQNFGNLSIAADMRREPELQSSARSRQTLCSTSSKRSVHKLGSREDVRLPRYLEKEKREKEEERLRELCKDLNCPLGHYALSEKERLEALDKAQHKMASLINELNHMPMTMETLRIRNRKVEIEKELTQIEFDIRLYSKPKVYIPKIPVQY